MKPRKKLFAGFGARATPDHILDIMYKASLYLGKEGYKLRSGGAPGADTAFEEAYISLFHDVYTNSLDGIPNITEIYYKEDATLQAIEVASRFHPAWNRCSKAVRQLHGRNAMILLGSNLNTPVNFGICWTKDGKATGGTGLGIRIANAYNIPIFNLHDPETLKRVCSKIGVVLL